MLMLESEVGGWRRERALRTHPDQPQSSPVHGNGELQRPPVDHPEGSS